MIDLYYTRKRIVRPDIQREVQQKKKKDIHREVNRI